MNDLEDQASPEGGIKVSDMPGASGARDQLLRFLQHMPNLADCLKGFAPSDAFRVIVSAENAKFFKQAADGNFKTFLHDGKHFVGNVELKRISPDYLSAASNILLSFNMAAIASDLNTIKIGVRDLGSLMSNTSRGEVSGAISAVRQAKALTIATEQRRETLGACRDLSVQLGMLAGQLKAHCSAMPEPKTGILDGFFGSGLDDADARWREVEDDLFVLKDGLSALLQTYSELGEGGAAREALDGILKGLRDANLTDAARKARLVKISAERAAPETIIKRFTQALTAIDQRLLNRQAPLLLPVVLDLKLEEFQSCQMPPDPASAAAN